MTAAPLATTEALRDTGRRPPAPFRVRLEDGGELTVTRLLRVLPGKRLVGEGDLDGERVLAKLFIARDSRRHMERERTGIVALSEAGIATPPLLRAGGLQGRGHYLLTPYLDDAQTLADFAPESEQAGTLLRTACRMLGDMHRHGLMQTDLHLGNFLIRGNFLVRGNFLMQGNSLMQGGDLYMLDGDGIVRTCDHRPVGARAARLNLALLLAQLPISLSDRHADWIRAYRESNPGVAFDDAVFAAEKRRVRDRRLRDFLNKSLRDCTPFKVERRLHRFTAVARAQADRLAPILADPDAWMTRGEPLKAGNTSTVVRVELDGGTVVIKRYNIKGTTHALSRALRPSRAWHAWREGHRLSALGIPTPAPLALIERRLGPLRGTAWLVTEHVEGADLHRRWAPHRDGELPEGDQRAILRLMRDLATARISHGDLKATNLIWQHGTIMPIDLDAMRQHRAENEFARACRRDMARFAANWPSDSTLHAWLVARLAGVCDI